MVNKTTRKRGKRSGGAGEAGEAGGAGEAGEAGVKAKAAKEGEEAKAAKVVATKVEADAEKAEKAGAAGAAGATAEGAKEGEAVKIEEAKVEAPEKAAEVVAPGAEEAEGAGAANAKGAEPGAEENAAAGAAAKVEEPEAAKEGEASPEPDAAKEGEASPEPDAAKEGEAPVAPGAGDGSPNTPKGILDALQNKSPEELQKEAEKLQKEAGESGSQGELHDALKTAQIEAEQSGAPGAVPTKTSAITTQPDDEVKKAVFKGGEALKDPIYKLFSSIILLTSYLLFCFATVLFINACININFLNKEVKDKDENSPIAMQPVFDYLKPNNFMFLDKFLLEPQSPVFITFIIIIGVSSACLGSLIVYWACVSNPNSDKRYEYWKESNIPKFPNIHELIHGNINVKDTKNIKKLEALLKYLPYLYILIILSTYNGITNDNRINLENFKKDTFDSSFKDFDKEKTNKTFTKKENQSGSIFLKELKNIIIRYIYNDISYNGIDIIRELENKLGETNANVSAVINSNSNIITKTIFDIYGKYYTYPVDPNKDIKEENDKVKYHKLTYINHINNYFNLLINDAEQSNANAKTKTNYYARFYLIGLIKNVILNDKYAADITHLTNLKAELNNKLEGVKNRIRGYYIAVITFYVLFICLICGFYWKDIGLYIWDLLVGYKLNNWRAVLIITIVFIILLVYGILFATKNKI